MAVRHGYGKIAGADALVFAYDTGDTRNSYKGEPTTNIVTNTPAQGGWGGTYTVLDSNTKTFRFTITSWSGTPGAAWRSYLWDVSAYTGQNVTISATFESANEATADFSWIMIGQTTGTQTYLGYSGEDQRNIKYGNTRERISWSGVVGDGQKVGFTVWADNGTGTFTADVSNVQIEIGKTHPTPFVNGTRSATQGLLDLTGNKSIDLSNVSFDSNAQIVYDGTNDYISFGVTDAGLAGASQATMELVVKIDALKVGSGGYQQIFGFRDNSDFDFFFLVFESSNNGLTEFRLRGANGTVFDLNPNILTYIGSYVHVTFTVSSTERVVYYNGAVAASGGGWNSSFGSSSTFDIGRYGVGNLWYLDGALPVAKIYNRALTAAEVRNNYNQYRGRFNI